MESASFCQRCPRRGGCSDKVTRSMDVRSFDMDNQAVRDQLTEQGRDSADHTLQKKFFDGTTIGQGLSGDMPFNTTLEDIAGCTEPQVVGREGMLGWKKIYDCGARMTALARSEE